MRSIYVAAFAPLVFCASMVRADTPADTAHQYAQFDGSATTITDLYTGLEWQRAPLPATKGFLLAQSSCPVGFRVPTLKELLTLVDESSNQVYVKGMTVQRDIDPSAFPQPLGPQGVDNAPVDLDYWSRTPVDTPVTIGYAVNFSTGLVTKHAIGDGLYVRCVK